MERNKDLNLISQWRYHMFNPDPTKQAAEICFSHKRNNVPHDPFTFNNNKIKSAPAQKYLGLIFNKINKCHKSISLFSFKGKPKAVQYNADLAITGAIRGTFRERLYRDRALETLNDRRWSRR